MQWVSVGIIVAAAIITIASLFIIRNARRTIERAEKLRHE